MSEIRYNPLDESPVRYQDGSPIPRILQGTANPLLAPFSDDDPPSTRTEGPYGMLHIVHKAMVYTKIPAPQGWDQTVCDHLALLGDGTACFVPGSELVLVDDEGTKDTLSRELQGEANYFALHTTPLLLDYGRWERGMGTRVVVQNETATAVVPYWASTPYEMLVIPTRRTFSALDEMRQQEEEQFIALCRLAASRLDALAGGPSLRLECLHQHHTNGHMVHMHLIPTIENQMHFPFEYGILSMYSCVISPEAAARALREGRYGESQ
ncbi:MAG: hypothetical protein LKK25_05190 [Sphaerochaeta sp.]|nr:hypothetical protein [Sphaerochaeta sp.]